MLNNIVNITLYLYSSATIFCLEIVIETLTPALREKRNIIVQSLSTIPQNLDKLYSPGIYCRFYSNIELVKSVF